MESALSVIADKLVEVAVKRACLLKVEETEIEKVTGISLRELGREVIERVSFWFVERQNQNLRCKLCSKGPFTRKGMYLHLVRLHRREVKKIIEEEIKLEISRIIKS